MGYDQPYRRGDASFSVVTQLLLTRHSRETTLLLVRRRRRVRRQSTGVIPRGDSNSLQVSASASSQPATARVTTAAELQITPEESGTYEVHIVLL